MSKHKYLRTFNEFLTEKENEEKGNDVIQDIISVLEDKGLIKSASDISDDQRKNLREQIMNIANEVENSESNSGGNFSDTDEEDEEDNDDDTSKSGIGSK